MISYDIDEQGNRRYYSIYEIAKDMTKHYGSIINCRKCGKVKFIADDAVSNKETDFYCSRACRNFKGIINKKMGLTKRH